MAKTAKPKEPMKKKAAAILTYLHPKANRELDLIAIRTSKLKHVKKHDLSIEGYTLVLRKYGYNGPVRVGE
jgi:hypothetical protein